MTRAWNEGADALAAWTAAGVAREGALDARLPLFLVGRANASATLPPAWREAFGALDENEDKMLSFEEFRHASLVALSSVAPPPPPPASGMALGAADGPTFEVEG